MLGSSLGPHVILLVLLCAGSNNDLDTPYIELWYVKIMKNIYLDTIDFTYLKVQETRIFFIWDDSSLRSKELKCKGKLADKTVVVLCKLTVVVLCKLAWLKQYSDLSLFEIIRVSCISLTLSYVLPRMELHHLVPIQPIPWLLQPGSRWDPCTLWGQE